jgi:hypothetical protein
VAIWDILGNYFLKKSFTLGKALASRLYQVQACDWVRLAQAFIPQPGDFTTTGKTILSMVNLTHQVNFKIVEM